MSTSSAPPVLERLRRRLLVQWGLAYLAGAWVALQVLGQLGESFGWPSVVLRVATLALGFGLLPILVLAYYHGEQGRQRVSGPELLMLAALFAIGGGVIATQARSEPAPDAGGTERAGASARITAQTGSLAVLPFADMSPGKDQEYFSDGIAEEILNALARVEGLKVAARTSSFSFKGKSVGVDEVGRQLGVEYVLDGSVRKDGSRLRIGVQLVKAADGFHVWSETYQQELEDVFTIQGDIARSVTEALRLKLGTRESASLGRSGTSSVAAHDLYLRGLAELNQRDMNKTIAYLEEAIEHDSSFAGAYASLAMAHAVRPFYDVGVRPMQAARLGRIAADHALALDPTLPDAYVASGALRTHYDWDFAGGERDFRRAIALMPDHVEAHRWLAQLLAYSSRHDEALAEARRAGELDPLSRFAVCLEGRVLAHAGEYEAAIQKLERAARVVPSCRNLLTAPLIGTRRYQQLVDLRVANLRGSADPNTPLRLQVVEDVYGSLARGQRPRTDRLRLLEQKIYGDGHSIGSMEVAISYAAAGDVASAMRVLEVMANARHPELLWLTSAVLTRELRAEPRYAALLARIGLPLNTRS